MGLPVGLATVTVAFGPYTDATGVPYTGAVTFTPSTPLVWLATGQVILDGSVSVALDSAGAGSIVLPATDATGLTAAGFTYSVTHDLTGADGRRTSLGYPRSIQLPQAAPSVVLELLAPVPASDGSTVAVQAVQSVAGLTGVVAAPALVAALAVPKLAGGNTLTGAWDFTAATVTGVAGGGGAASLLDRGAWVTSTTYAVGDVVTQGGQRYACRTAHTAAALFATDSAASRWVALDAVAAAADGAVVHLAGAETVTGVKTFTAAPVVPSAAFPESAVAGLTADLAAKAPTTRTITAGTGLTGGGDLTADRTLTVAYGTLAGTAAQGNDSRLTDARTPTGAASGDLSGTYPAPTVAKVNGVTVTGSPSAGQTVIASSSTAAAWGTVSVAGEVAGSAATYGTLPTANPQGQALRNGDVAYLTADTIGTGTSANPQWPRGAYTWNGAAWVLAIAIGADLQFGTVAGTIAQGNDARIVGALQAANNLSDVASAATARTNLGLGGAATLAVGTTTGTVAAGDDSRITGAAQKASNLSDLASASTARTNLGLGTAATLASSAVAQTANNLSDLASASTARTNLGLGTAATISATAGGDLSGTLPSPTVARINGVAVTGTPTTGQTVTATSSTTATWQTPSGGGGGGSVTSVVGKTGDVTGAQIAADPALAPAVAAAAVMAGLLYR